jgi:alkylated DNA repair protein alkB family protein 8
MKRVLRPGGRALITVWAKEQKYKEKESYYISVKNSKKQNPAAASVEKKDDEPDTSNSSAPNVHKFGKEFEKKDVFVAWHCNTNAQKKKRSKKTSEEGVDATDRPQQLDEREEEKKQIYLRFYHVFENKELESLFNSVSDVQVIESFYEQGNWCVIFEKNNFKEN